MVPAASSGAIRFQSADGGDERRKFLGTSQGDTRDLLQELFVKLARRPQLLDKVRDERAFLLRLAHNLAIDLMRSLKNLMDPEGILNPHKVLPEQPPDDEFLDRQPGWYPDTGQPRHRAETGF